MKALVVFHIKSGEPDVVKLEDLQTSSEMIRCGLSPFTVVEHTQISFEDALKRARPVELGLISRLRKSLWF